MGSSLLMGVRRLKNFVRFEFDDDSLNETGEL